MNKRPAGDELCSFFLTKKKRSCRMKKDRGMAYCPHHSHLSSDKNDKKGARVPCPLDPSHFCYEKKLQKHLKKCNAREKDKPEYFVENINVSDVKDADAKITMNDINDSELLELISRIKVISKEINLDLPEECSLHPVIQREMEASSDKLNKFKHMRQQASLLSLMDSHGLLSDGSCFIEFGAGKGQLICWVIQCCPEKEKCVFVLIDRSPQRYKNDNKFKGTDIQIERIRIDIQNLHLGKIPCVKPHISKVVGLCKHLCGSATDLALHCLTNTLEISTNENEKTTHNPLGMVMALCCHHRCSWNSYVGKDFLTRKGLSEKEFKLMCCIAGWATCGLRKKKIENMNQPEKETETGLSSAGQGSNLNVDEDNVHIEPVMSEEALNRYVKLNLNHEERENIGLACKRIIDAGRIEYLKNKGYEVKLVKYIDRSVSLENVALVASYKKS